MERPRATRNSFLRKPWKVMNKPHSITDRIMNITGNLPKAKFKKSPNRVMIPFSEPT